MARFLSHAHCKTFTINLWQNLRRLFFLFLSYMKWDLSFRNTPIELPEIAFVQ